MVLLLFSGAKYSFQLFIEAEMKLFHSKNKCCIKDRAESRAENTYSPLLLSSVEARVTNSNNKATNGQKNGSAEESSPLS